MNILRLIGIVLLIAWVLGMTSFAGALGSFVHIILVLAIISLVVSFIRKV